jgi:hypothetical protein
VTGSGAPEAKARHLATVNESAVVLGRNRILSCKFAFEFRMSLKMTSQFSELLVYKSNDA